MMLKRTHTCGQLRKADAGGEVTLNGWIHAKREHGGLTFIDLRDRYGKTQVVFDESQAEKAAQRAKGLGLEDVIAVRGKVVARPPESLNRDMATGEIDVQCLDLEVLSEAQPLPFLVSDRKSAHEEQRLTYRYLELCTDELQHNIITRSRIYQVVRDYFTKHDFLEVETPYLMKSTPEGARDYLVPSRLHHGRFYALPQSPQMYKQLLMIAGLDRYFQIVKCFRDEDLRAHRQPEFTQIDVELSFVDEDDVLSMMEGLIAELYREIQGVELPETFPRLIYRDAMERFGCDKPDLRYGLELQEFAPYVEGSEFNTFKDVLAGGGRVKALVVPGAGGFSRKEIDALTSLVTTYHGANGLAWMKGGAEGLEGGIAKFFPDEVRRAIISGLNVAEGDLVLCVGDREEVALPALGALREEMARRRGLIAENEVRPLWVVDFPMLSHNDAEGRWEAVHHPFTAVHPEDADRLESDPASARSRGYDLVINGYEIAGGSIRNHDAAMQERMFRLLGISPEEANEKFGFFLEALRYGTPPHGGIAFGFDRLVMILVGASQIRDVIAFPKTTSALSLMDGAPAAIQESQLHELGLALRDAGKRGDKDR